MYNYYKWAEINYTCQNKWSVSWIAGFSIYCFVNLSHSALLISPTGCSRDFFFPLIGTPRVSSEGAPRLQILLRIREKLEVNCSCRVGITKQSALPGRRSGLVWLLGAPSINLQPLNETCFFVLFLRFCPSDKKTMATQHRSRANFKCDCI